MLPAKRVPTSQGIWNKEPPRNALFTNAICRNFIRKNGYLYADWLFLAPAIFGARRNLVRRKLSRAMRTGERGKASGRRRAAR